MSITAVVPVWNGRELLARLLATLDAQTLRADEVIAVDNGSTDGAPDLVRARGGRVIAMGRNAGFAAAVNRGIQAAGSDWIAVLNTDVELAPDYLQKLTGAGAPFATGKIFDARRNGLLDGTFDLTCRGATTWRAGNGRPDGPEYAKRREIWSAPWTAALFHREVFRKIGLLDECFESYLEDVDFGLRCAAHAVRGAYVPEAVAWHRGSASLGYWHPDTVRRIARNQVWLATRYMRGQSVWPVIAAQALWGGVACRHGCALSWMRGMIEGFSKKHPAQFSTGLTDQLRRNECEIRGLQTGSGLDLYWRLYFLFTGGGAK